MNQQKFKDTEIGMIPKEWKVVKLDTIADIETGKRAKGGGLSKGSVASIGGEHIDQDGNILWDKMKFIPESFYEDLNQGKVRLGDILMVKDGATTGKTCIVRNLPYEKVAINEHVFLIKSKAGAISEFLFYVLFSKVGQNQIKLKFHGLIGGIKRGDIKSIIIPLPPLPEQQKIAEILSTVDSAIEKVNQAIAKIERLKKGLMQELLTKGIGRKEFKDTEIGRIPKEWEVVRLGEVIKLCQYGLSVKISDQGKYPIIKMDDIVNGYVVNDNVKYVDIDEETYRKFKLEKGDVLFNRTNSYELVGRTGIFLLNGGYVFASYLIRLKPNRKIVNPHFLTFYLIFSNEKIRQLATRAVHQANINATNLQNLKLPLPPLPEQQKIAEILSTVDKRLELLRAKKEKLERIKKGLMHDLLTGKRRVKV